MALESLRSAANLSTNIGNGLQSIVTVAEDPTKVPAVQAAKNVYEYPMDNLLPGYSSDQHSFSQLPKKEKHAHCKQIYDMCQGMSNEQERQSCMATYKRYCK